MKFRMIFPVLAGLVLAVIAVASMAAIDSYNFPNEQMRDRYKVLIEKLRCPQCLNTNIAGSDAMIAKDLRREVHRLLLEGKSNEEILDYMHERYGDFILYEPRLNMRTLLLWFGPGLLILIALVAGFKLVRARNAEKATLTETDQERLQKLLGDKEL